MSKLETDLDISNLI